MILAFNLNRLMQLVAFPTIFKEQKMKALRFHIIQLPKRVISHARQLWLRAEAGHFLTADLGREYMYQSPRISV